MTATAKSMMIGMEGGGLEAEAEAEAEALPEVAVTVPVQVAAAVATATTTTTTTTTTTATATPTETTAKAKIPPPTPAWMLEMEGMEEEEGVLCVVCQEGYTYKPKECLCTYVHMVKSVENDVNGVEGVALFLSVPGGGGAGGLTPAGLMTKKEKEKEKEKKKGAAEKTTTPTTTRYLQTLITPATWKEKEKEKEKKKGAAEKTTTTTTTRYLQTLITTAKSGVSAARSRPTSRRQTSLIASTSASNAIHYKCHIKAKDADRSHKKAPKSEWEGERAASEGAATKTKLTLFQYFTLFRNTPQAPRFGTLGCSATPSCRFPPGSRARPSALWSTAEWRKCTGAARRIPWGSA